MHKISLIIILCICLLQTTIKTYSIISIESLHSYSAKDLQNSLIKITQSSLNIKILPQYANMYYMLTVSNSNKRKSYDLFKSRYDKLVSLLKQNRIIENEGVLIKNQMKYNYNSRSKLWEFGLAFCVEMTGQQVDRLGISMEQIGVKVLKNGNEIKYLQGKWISTKIYHVAKNKLQKIIANINQNLQIKYVDDIEIDGFCQYQQKIQQQLQNSIIEIPQVNSSIYYKGKTSDNSDTEPEGENVVQMEIYFKIGQKKQSQNFNSSIRKVDVQQFNDLIFKQKDYMLDLEYNSTVCSN